MRTLKVSTDNVPNEMFSFVTNRKIKEVLHGRLSGNWLNVSHGATRATDEGQSDLSSRPTCASLT